MDFLKLLLKEQNHIILKKVTCYIFGLKNNTEKHTLVCIATVRLRYRTLLEALKSLFYFFFIISISFLFWWYMHTVPKFQLLQTNSCKCSCIDMQEFSSLRYALKNFLYQRVCRSSTRYCRVVFQSSLLIYTPTCCVVVLIYTPLSAVYGFLLYCIYCVPNIVFNHF